MKIERTTYNLNLTICGDDSRTAKIQVEGISPMTKDEFWDWIVKMSRADLLPKTSRPSTEVWRDTRESPRPLEEKMKMDEFAKQYKKLKRQFPQASHEVLKEKTNEFLKMKDKVLEDFKANFKLMLERKD